MDLLLLKSQKNEILIAIKKIGLNPENFNWGISVSRFNTNVRVSRLDYKNTNFYFVFDTYQESHYGKFSPGSSETVNTVSPGSWDLQMEYVEGWLNYLKREVEEPDLWELLSEEKDLNIFVSDDIVVSESIQIDDHDRIENNLNELKEYLLKFGEVNVSNQKIIMERLEYLNESSKRVNKKDWTLMLGGTLLSIIVGILRNPVVIREFITLANKLFSWLSGTPLISG